MEDAICFFSVEPVKNNKKRSDPVKNKLGLLKQLLTQNLVEWTFANQITSFQTEQGGQLGQPD